MPVRVPESEPDSERLRERRGQDQEERDHVRQHRVRPRAAPQLVRKRPLEADPSADAAGGAEGANAHVRRQVMASDGVAEDGDRLAPRRERANDVHRLRQHRMVGVDGLRDEDEAHGQRTVPATAASTSERMSRARSSGVASQSSKRTFAAAPSRSARSRSLRSRRIAAARLSVSNGRTSSPSTPSVTRSGMPPAVGRDDGPPACERLDQDPAETFRPRREHERRRLVERLRDSGGLEPAVVLDTIRELSPPACGRLRAASRSRPARAVPPAARPPAPATQRRGRRRSCRARATPTKSRVGRSGNGATGCSVNAERSL